VRAAIRYRGYIIRCGRAATAKGLYEFFREKYPNEKKFYDMIPTLLEKKYLKTIPPEAGKL
jgi:hypothetical protein